jgi:hypothetical protein
MATETLHIAKEYANGIGHIDEREGRYLVSFYGRRVRQIWASTLGEARGALRRLADGR